LKPASRASSFARCCCAVSSGCQPNAGYPGNSQGASGIAAVATQITISANYSARSAQVIASMAAATVVPGTTNPAPYVVTVQLGTTEVRFGNESSPNLRPTWDTPENIPYNIPLNSERGYLAVAISGGNIAQYTVTIEVLCVQTNEAFAQWQLDTYSSIYQAYLSLQSSYQQAVGQNQQSLAGSNYPGSSPDENQRVVQIELKREVISLVTLQQFDPANIPVPLLGNPSLIATPATSIDPSVGSGPNNQPSTESELNFAATFSLAPLIRFLEEGFEWDQMQYIFYPHYWNQKDEWFNLALLEDPDPTFTQFLRAGAARVVVPVQPVLKNPSSISLQTGQPWDGGSPPQVYDPLYLSIATEIAQADQQPVTETLVPPTWTMRLPTTLTMLRSDTPTIAPYAASATYVIG